MALGVDLELLSPTNQEGTHPRPWPSLLGQVVDRVIGDVDLVLPLPEDT